ncbi:MAG: IPT/TIG domain-containing protein [bacterium]|nr:IPT/TIG domain-containing protein [bacterium]
MAAPTITAINGESTNVQVNMNATITITGSNFTGAVNILFGSTGTPPGTFHVNSDTEITATIPVMEAGTTYPLSTTAQVVVPNQPVGNTFPITIENPTKITNITPNPALVGNKLYINGAGFKGANYVEIESTQISSSEFTMDDLGTQIVLTVPKIAADNYPINTTVTVHMDSVSSNSKSISVHNPKVVNTITLKNNSKLDTTQYTVWVAGFIEQQVSATDTQFLFLQSSGKFETQTATKATFLEVDSVKTMSIPNIESAGNNRLVFLVTKKDVTPAAFSPKTPYAAYPFKNKPTPCPEGPYDIFEFGPIAQYDVSAVDSFGLNLSFTVTGDPLTYGAVPGISREEIGDAFTAFCISDPLGGKGFSELLYSSSGDEGYPSLIENQFSAIVSPKDWLAIYPSSQLASYWTETVNAFFTDGNQLDLFLNAANVGNYSGTSDGKKFTLTGPNKMQIIIPASDFNEDQGFIQAVRDKNKGETDLEYKTFGQIEAAIFEAISRGVALDGVKKAGTTIPKNYSSDAWTKYENWFTHTNNTYNQKPRVYDVYAKFFHYATFGSNSADQQFIFGENGAKKFGMAYGFSLDEDPNVGNWPKDIGVPAKTVYYVGFKQDVTLEIGPFMKQTS